MADAPKATASGAAVTDGTAKTTKAERTPLSISLPTPLAQTLRDEADKRVVNLSLLVEKALERFLPTLPEV